MPWGDHRGAKGASPRIARRLATAGPPASGVVEVLTPSLGGRVLLTQLTKHGLLERASGPPPPRTLAVLWWPASSLFSGLHPLRRGDHPMASTRCAEKHPSLALTPSALTPPALTSSGPLHSLPLHTLHLLPCGAQCGGSVAPYSWRQLMAAYHHCGEARYLQLR